MLVKCSACKEVVDNKMFCFKCENKIKTSFLKDFPDLLKEWDFKKNNLQKIYPWDVSKGCNKKSWWRCKSGKECHSWEATINNRACKETNCPFCNKNSVCSCEKCDSLYFSHKDLIETEWDFDLNNILNLNPKNISKRSHKRAWWRCSKNSSHSWKTIIKSRTGKIISGCPHCRSSKLEMETKNHFLKNNLLFQEQYRTQTCKNKIPLPFDFRIIYKNKPVRCELQGYQHFDSGAYHNRKRKFETVIQTDIKKCVSTYSDKENYIVISYLCINNIDSIVTTYLKDLESNFNNNPNSLLFRFQITPNLHLDFNTNSNIPQPTTKDDNLLIIHQSYFLKLQALKNFVSNTNETQTFILCKLCERSFIPSLIQTHYQTEQHINSRQQKKLELEEKYDNLFSITEDGIPILIDNNDNED